MLGIEPVLVLHCQYVGTMPKMGHLNRKDATVHSRHGWSRKQAKAARLFMFALAAMAYDIMLAGSKNGSLRCQK